LLTGLISRGAPMSLAMPRTTTSSGAVSSLISIFKGARVLFYAQDRESVRFEIVL